MVQRAAADEGERATAPDRRLGELFAELADGRVAALDELYDLTSREIFGLALWRTGSREDANDVVQDVFLKVARQRQRLADVRDARSWLLSVAHRAAIDVMRRRVRRPTEPLDCVGLLEAPPDEPDRSVDAERASRLIAELPPAQREVVYLHHQAGCTFAAIGRITGVPTFTAASRYRLGLKKLRKLMGVTT